jgi:hypothetical protein
MSTSCNEMVDSFSDNEIIRRRKEAPPDLLLGDPSYGYKVLKLTDKLAVKFGFLLGEDEARNQSKAHELLDPSIVRVPKVYRHFMDSNDHGYIIIDLMKGVIKDFITESSEKSSIVRILEHFASIKSQKLGPLTGGPSRCFLFGESDYPIFQSI